MAVKYTKLSLNIPRFSSKIDQKWDFWFENKPSGNSAWKYFESGQKIFSGLGLSTAA
jgi:hypothetical protein